MLKSVQVDLDGLEPGIGVDLELWLPPDSTIVHVLGNAANTVTAHLRSATVGVVHLHAAISQRGRGRLDENETVASHAEVAVRDAPSDFRGIQHLFGKAVYEDIVVPDAMHLGEVHARYYNRSRGLHPLSGPGFFRSSAGFSLGFRLRYGWEAASSYRPSTPRR